MDIQGAGGSGKTYLLNAITSNLHPTTYKVAAPSGCAATLINGTTIHSLLKINTNSSSESDSVFHPPALNIIAQKQDEFRNVRFLFIDEKSMISQTFLSMIDASLRLYKQETNLLFGGVSVILLGDMGQLPPINGKSLIYNYNKRPSSSSSSSTTTLNIFSEFTHKFKLTGSMRTSSVGFYNLLEDLRHGRNIEACFKILKMRRGQYDDSSNKTVLFPTKKLVTKLNSEDLHNHEPLVAIQGEGGGLTNSSFEDILVAGVGAKVMLRWNLSVPRGFFLLPISFFNILFDF